MNKLYHAIMVLALYRHPWMRVLDWMGLLKAKTQYPVWLRNGLVFAARGLTSDFSVIDEVFIHGVYDQALSRLEGGARVIDVGAHIGVFALAAAARGATALCYEPLPENFEVLVSNLARNSCGRRVKAYQLAIAGRGGEIDFFTVDGDTGGGTSFPAIHQQWHDALKNQVIQQKVEATTLHDILVEHDIAHCDCLKLDCEGMEYDILVHTSEADLGKVSAVILEHHPSGSLGALCDRLGKAGFDRIEVTPKFNLLFACRSRPS